jgi:EAL domain-containing protein (putative c-di-GMP-specific phosphodiesterase class I)
MPDTGTMGDLPLGDVDDAIGDGALSVVYQPVVALPERAMTGVEALVRWRHPALGQIPPSVFVPALEHRREVAHLDHWVRQRLMCDLRHVDGLIAYTNVSVQEVHEDLAEAVVLLARQLEFPLDRLVVEVSERDGLGDLEIAARHLSRLRDHGVRVALDDVGSGHAGLDRLAVLPIDVVKIDRGLIARLGTGGPRAERVVGSLIELTHRLGAVTIAEGVETEEQADILVALGCDCAQGYWHSRPGPPASIGIVRGTRAAVDLTAAGTRSLEVSA